VCDAVWTALKDPSEKTKLGQVLERISMKAKLDWVSKKLDEVQKQGQPQRPPNWPDTAAFTVAAIYNFLRVQRNDLGHPSDVAPIMSIEQAFANLQIFPMYYKNAEELRAVLAAAQI
jgi:hypothetical protein